MKNFLIGAILGGTIVAYCANTDVKEAVDKVIAFVDGKPKSDSTEEVAEPTEIKPEPETEIKPEVQNA